MAKVDESKYPTFLNQKRLTKNDYYEYKKENKKFTDELYPANEHSIYSQNEKGEFNDKTNGEKLKKDLEEDLELEKNKTEIEWERISDREYFRNIYSDKISHEHIEQGSLSNCYLISLISSISHYPKLIIGEKDKDMPHLLYNIEYGDIGYYEIMFFIDGSFQIVIIDDYIPFFKGSRTCIFSESSENLFWVNLVEKAYSKICGGYTSMVVSNNKNPYDHFQVFTGFKPERHELYDEEKKEFVVKKDQIDELYNSIEKNIKDDSKKFNIIITAGTPDENKGLYLEENFIPYKHSFSIFDCQKIKINNNQSEMKLLLLNNPWGRNVYDEGIGKYCLENLDENVINLKPYIENNKNSKDGTFWIDFDSFIKNYVLFSICKIPCNYQCKNYYLSSKKFFEIPLLFKLEVDKKSNVWFNINLARSKSIINHEEKIQAFVYFVINQINEEGKIVKSFSNTSLSNDFQNDYDLEKGNYIIWIYIPKKYASKVNELNANFMVSSNNKISIKFLNYDTNFKFLKNISECLFKMSNKGKKSNNDTEESKLIKYLIDSQSINGFIILCFRNQTKNKKMEVEPELKNNGFESLLNDECGIDSKNLKFDLLPGESKFFIGIASINGASFSVDSIKLKYTEGHKECAKPKECNFLDYIKEKDKTNDQIKFVTYLTNPYNFIKTNFNKDKEQRHEENLFNFFVSLMSQKMEKKGITKEKIRIISQNLWDGLKKEEKDKIRQKFKAQQKKLENIQIKNQVLKYVKRNSLKMNNPNKLDNEIKNMRMKARLSKEIGIIKFEDDLDQLGNRIKNILSRIENLKKAEKEEAEVNQFIKKQNSLEIEFKKLAEEKITRENAQKIDEKKVGLVKEFQLFNDSIKKSIGKFENIFKSYEQITKDIKKLTEELNEQNKIFMERKLDAKKELTELADKFNAMKPEFKKLKIPNIYNKFLEILKKQKEISSKIETIQKGLKSLMENIKKEKNDKIEKQKELLSKDMADKFSERYTELNNKLKKIKETDKFYDVIETIIKDENDLKTTFKSILDTNIDEKNLKSTIDNFNKTQSKREELIGKITNFQKIFIPYVDIYNKYIEQREALNKEIYEIYSKYQENKLQINDQLGQLLIKRNEIIEQTNKLKFREIVEKNKNCNTKWDEIKQLLENTINKLKSLSDKGISIFVGDKEKAKELKIEKEKKNKEIIDKINKDMIPLLEKQKEIINMLDKLKKDKINCLNTLNSLANEEDKILNEIKVVYNNDIKNINKENFKNNFEKYKKFDENFHVIHEKIKNASNTCNELVDSYKKLIETLNENRKKIIENYNKFPQNNIEVDDKNKKIIQKEEEILDEIKKFKINDINDVFNNKVNKKINDINSVRKVLIELSSKK